MKHELQKRILYVLQYLYANSDEQNPKTASDILAYLSGQGIDCTRKGIYADIAMLEEMGVDIICRRSTQNLYFIGSRTFQLPELKLLVDAVESSHFITRKKSDELIDKLCRLTSVHQAQQLNRRIYMDSMAKPENEAIYYIVDKIQTAIHNEKQVTFQYLEYTHDKKKVLKHDGRQYSFSPYVLIWNRDFYYAVGYSESHGKVAQFRVDRMVNSELTEIGAILTPDFDVSEYMRRVFGMYDDEVRGVELICENELMRSVIDRFGEGVQAKPTDSRHFSIKVNVAPSPPFFAWVFTFGGRMRIASPPDVLEEMRSMAAWLK